MSSLTCEVRKFTRTVSHHKNSEPRKIPHSRRGYRHDWHPQGLGRCSGWDLPATGTKLTCTKTTRCHVSWAGKGSNTRSLSYIRDKWILQPSVITCVTAILIMVSFHRTTRLSTILIICSAWTWCAGSSNYFRHIGRYLNARWWEINPTQN